MKNVHSTYNEENMYNAEDTCNGDHTGGIASVEDRESMEKRKSQSREQRYKEYVSQVTPSHNLIKNMGKAFLTGGLICVLGQAIQNWCLQMGMDEKTAATWCSLGLIFLSAMATGAGWYSRLGNWAGAGTLVPITGFSNSVAAPAVEFKKEGQIFGIGCKIFTIAGPVILYGILSSWVLGAVYYLFFR